MQRVTGIGGIFFKSSDPKALGAWYREHLGLDVTEWGGVVFHWGGMPAGIDPLEPIRAGHDLHGTKHLELHDQLPGR